MPENCLKIAVRKFDAFENVVQAHWDNYVAETGCDLKIEAVPMDLTTLYDSMFTHNGMQNGSWDIGQVNTDWIAGAREMGVLLDLAPFIAAAPPEDYPDGWHSSMLHFQTYGDEVYGLPFHDGPECFIYRKDLFNNAKEQKAYIERYDEPLRVPQTWEEFVRVARFFHRPDDNLYGTVFAAFPDRHNNVFDFSIQLWSRGGELMRNNKVVLNTTEAKDSLEFYRALINDPSAVHPRCMEMDSIASGTAFARGEVAMMANWFGFATMCETIEGSMVQGKVGIAGLPHLPGVEPFSLNVYYTWSIGAGSKHKELAYDFIKFCAAKRNDRLLPLLGAVGCRRSTWEDEEVNRIIPYYGELGNLHQYAKTFPKTPRWHYITEVIDELMVEVVNTTKSVQEILDEAQKKLDN